jgi:hypothetical protein
MRTCLINAGPEKTIEMRKVTRRSAAAALLLLAGVPLAAGMQLKWCTVEGRESGGQLEKDKCDLMATIVTAQFAGRHTLVCVSRDDCHTSALEVRAHAGWHAPASSVGFAIRARCVDAWGADAPPSSGRLVHRDMHPVLSPWFFADGRRAPRQLGRR